MPLSTSTSVVPSPRSEGTTVLPEPAEPVIRAMSTTWTARGFEITGVARHGDRDTGRLAAALTRVWLRPTGNGSAVRVRTRALFLPEATDDSEQTRFSHDWAGFTASVDPERLRRGGRWRDGEWQVEVVLQDGLRTVHGAVAQHWCGSGEYPLSRWVGDAARIVPHFHGGALRIRVENVRARITGAERDGDALLLSGAADLPEGSVLRLRHRESSAEPTFPLRPAGAGRFTVRVGLEHFTGVADPEREHWDAELVRPDGSAVRPVLDHRQAPIAGQFRLPGADRVLYLKELSDGYPQFCAQQAAGLVGRITATADGFELTGHAPLPDRGPLELVLRHDQGTGESVHRLDGGEHFTVHLPAMRTDPDGRRFPLRKGVWGLRIRPAGQPDAEQPVLLAPDALTALPLPVEVGSDTTGTKRVLLQRRWHDTLIVDSTPVLSAAERSAYAQERLREVHYPQARQQPLREAVLYDVFSGRGYADSPRAVHAELVRRGEPLEHLWAVDDAQAEVPAGVRPVRVFSPEWYEALATSRYLVGNTHLPEFLERRPGQVVVQTWHGSLIKRIAHDVENSWLGDAGYLAALDREVPNWSLLVSPSGYATPILRRAFRYEGEVLESGYPRNDVLARAGTAEAAELRRRLGLPEGKRVVLYAPTWREDQQAEGGEGFRLDLRIDVAAAKAALGEDHVLLVRPHAHVREPLLGAGDGFLYDLASYPDVQDLLLAADVLVTDYSSIAFDFAVTGRPMLFFTYDLEHYRDTLRGFYFDFEQDAPGPLVPGSAELVAGLRRLADEGALPERYEEKYRRFRELHCRLDDGGAAGRVVTRMLELGAEQAPVG
ncbi:CDP-glycerol glycerophosphotransferase family protein [Kitasatospora sp. NPDC048365]|uniref:CDP-glycerol glycerophosphotransferase family protein n=1 Tax=Kitasatospora sp. NPDC048365 TaxID=3364050 RepID=UPI003715423E